MSVSLRELLETRAQSELSQATDARILMAPSVENGSELLIQMNTAGF
jgi:hypothetical protein